MRNIALKLILLSALLCCQFQIFGQLSKVHYMPPIASGDNVGDQWLYVSTPNEGFINVTIKPIGGDRSDWETKSINAKNPWIFPIFSSTFNGLNSGAILDLNSTSNSVIDNAGYIIESEDVTYVSFRFNSTEVSGGRQYHSGAYVSKGAAALGTRFRPGNFIGVPGYTNGGNSSEGHSFISILATEDNTLVRVSNIPSGVSILNFSGASNLEQVLQQNESWILGITATTDDMRNNDDQIKAFVGSLISTSDHLGSTIEKPVVVVSGSIENTALSDPDITNRDFGLDQIVGADKVGHEYILIRGLGHPEVEKVYVIADSDNTEVFRGSRTTPVMLNEGEHVVYSYNDYESTGNLYITTKNPAKKLFIYQTTGYDARANQALVFVPPLSCSTRGNIDNIPEIDKIGSKEFTGGTLSIVTEDTAVLEIYKTDGSGNEILFADSSGSAPVNLASLAKTVIGKPGYTTYLLDSSGTNSLSGNISVFSDKELYVSSTTYGDAASSGSYYSGFVSNPPIRNDLTVSTLGNCILEDGSSNVILSTSSAFDSFRWMKYNPATNTYQDAPGTYTTSTYIPLQTGVYKLLGKLACFPTTDYLSDEIVVSICPKDRDNDGVPDNIDLDNDNDGILDAVESSGDGSVDFTTIGAPIIKLPSSSPAPSNGSTTSTSGSISGGASGKFSSTITATGTNETITYRLNPIVPTTEKVNLRIRENDAISKTANPDEVFKLIAFPSTENFTLLDPGEKLLANDGTGFKIIPMQGITGNQLEFKYNPSPLDISMPYEILGVNLVGFEYVHKLSAVSTTNSEFHGIVEIINYKKDSDGDGAINAFDDDSDNDGCPDVIEAGFKDPDGDKSAGTSPIFYDPSSSASTADSRGRVIYSGYDYTQPPINGNENGAFDFQEVGSPATFSIQPKPTRISENDNATFSVTSSDATSYQWQMDGTDINDSATFVGTSTNTLRITTTDTSLSGKKFSVLIHSNSYLCTSPSSAVTLTVLALPIAPILDKLYAVCDSGTIGDLKTLIGLTDINVYENETGGSILADSTPLINGEDYFVSAFNALGDESLLRSKTDVLIASPVINASKNILCLGDNVSLTVTGAPQTVPDFEAANPRLTKFLVDRGSAYFYDPVIQSWEDANSFISTLGSGATMYQINSVAEHDAVWDALVANEYHNTGRFWLGLKQYNGLKGTPEQIDLGWRWLDGRNLDPSWNLWYDNPSTAHQEEPNDSPPQCDTGCTENGDEDYGQFNYIASMGKFFNDIGENTGNSRAVIEFSGVSDVKWYKQEVGGLKTLINGAKSNSLTETPTKTTTYFYEVVANGITCSDSITITVNDLPLMLPADAIEECDTNLDGDSTNMNVADFDLAQQEKDIIGSISDRAVLFFESNTSAQSLSGVISTTSTYTNTANPQTIHYRIKNTITGCLSSDIKTFDLIVKDLPPELVIPDIHKCDDRSVGTEKDGLRKFDLTENTTAIEGLLSGVATNYEISYHASLTEAKNNYNAITAYTTTLSDSSEKEVFVRIKDKTSECVRFDNSFKVVVDKLPVLKNSLLVIEQCESDGKIKYDLAALAANFSDNHANETFSFYRDAARSIPVLDPMAFISTRDIKVYVAIQNDKSGCERHDDLAAGIGEVVIDLRVGTNSVPATFTPKMFYDCFDAASSPTPGIGVFNPTVFTEITNELLLVEPNYNSPTVEITYYESELDALFQNNAINSAIPYSNNTPYAQEIWVGIEDVGVSTITCLGRIKVADFIVDPVPDFTLPSTQVFCKDLGSDTISVTNVGATYEFSWTHNGIALPNTTQGISITEGGTYTVTATNPKSQCSTTKTIEVAESEIPQFDTSDLSVLDLTGNNSNRIEIKTGIADLGIGDYHFALNGGVYQDSPIFEDVPPGIHTIRVQDKNGCGVRSLNVSIIGYAYFFTPNNDGQNDTWHVLGVSSLFQAESLIYIFDRHGRLLDQISPSGPGWDGTYNGAPLPADDYWFSVKLEDGRTFTGHFSLIR